MIALETMSPTFKKRDYMAMFPGLITFGKRGKLREMFSGVSTFRKYGQFVQRKEKKP